MTFINKYKKYLTVSAILWVASLAISILVYILFVSPQSRERNHIETLYTESQQEYDTAKIAAQKGFQEQLRKELLSLEEKLDSFVIDFEDSENLKFDISRIAGEKKVSSFSIEDKYNTTTSAVSDPNYISENYMNISFVAEFNQFAAFINTIERHQPVLFVNEFKVIPSNKDKTSYQVSLGIAALVKRQEDNKTVSKSTEGISSDKIQMLQ